VSPFDTAWSLIKAPMWYGDDEEKPPANPRYDMLEHMSWGLDPNSWQQAWESEDGLARAIVKPDHNEGNWLISHYEIQDNEFAQGHGRGTQYLGELIDTLREDENPHGDFENPYDVHVTHVDPPAIGFWEKMVDRGVIDGAHETAWVRKTPDGEEHFTHPYNHESKKPYKPQMIAKNDRTLDFWKRTVKRPNEWMVNPNHGEPYKFVDADYLEHQGHPDFDNWRGGRKGGLSWGANRYALVGDDTVEKIPSNYGRAQSKSALATLNALASLGYPIVPETPIGTDNPRFFPTEQKKVDQSFGRDYDEHGLPLLHTEPSAKNKKFQQDLNDLNFEVAVESPLGYALGIGDIIDNEDNVGYDEDGNLVAIDPFVGNKYELRRFGETLGQMAGPVSSKNTIYQRRRSPSYLSHSANDMQEATNHKLAQQFKQVDPMQLDSFTQLYHDREQFKPWDAVEEKLFSDPQSFGQYTPNTTQYRQLRETIDKDNQRYKDMGAALNWMNTPPEQKRLFEFGDNAHARRYRNMLASLNY
jgi:GNAT superfamily N-acetyltransferase